MKAEDCKMHARVALIGKTAPLRKGTIVGEVSQHAAGPVVIVEWDNGNIQKITTSSLLMEAEGLKEDARLQSELLKLEEEFRLIKEGIADKLNTAAKLINEATVAAHSSGQDLLYMSGVTDALFHALDNVGWSTSSFDC